MDKEKKEKADKILADFYESINHLANKIIYARLKMDEINRKEARILDRPLEFDSPKRTELLHKGEVMDYLESKLRTITEEKEKKLLVDIKADIDRMATH